jgi:transposase
MSRRRIEMYQYRNVLMRMRRGDSDRDIARSKSMGRRKLAQLRALAIKYGWLSEDGSLPDDETIVAQLGPPKRAPSTISAAAGHRTLIERWVQQKVSAVAIHAALKREHNWHGSYASVYRMVVAIKGAQPPAATVPLIFAPGEAAQVDFGAGPLLHDPARGELRRTWCFVMTLCYSRHQYAEFVWDQTVATWLGCHRRAFEWFGAVPAKLIIDNAKCAIIKACRFEPQVQRAYAECAQAYDFQIAACAPADPQKKGIVEAGVKYIKGNFLPTRQFRDLADLNAQARTWVLQEAGQRIHGSTHERPLERFAADKPLMKPLPAVAPDLGSWHRLIVHRDCHVAHQRMLYSVPYALVGKTVWLRATDGAVAIFDEHRLIATHPRGRRPGERSTVRDHLPPHAAAFLAHDRHWCLAQAEQIGPATLELVQRLLGDRLIEKLRAAQGVIRLQRFGNTRLEAACARALYHASAHYRTVKSILAGGFDQQPLPAAKEQSSASVHGAAARFVRSAHSLFDPDADVRH